MDDLQYNKMSFFRKIIIVTVFVLLILWFIFFIRIGSRLDDNVVDSNYDKNISLMEDVARKYFTEDVLKEDTFISLKEMYRLELINVLKTSDGKKCVDIASFAKVKVLEYKYQLDVVLVCGDNNKTKTSYYDLSCGLSCDD